MTAVDNWIYKSGIQSGSLGQIQNFRIIRIKVVFKAMGIYREKKGS